MEAVGPTTWNLAVGPGDTAMQVMHSSRYLLVDRNGKVRATYDFKTPGYVNQIVVDAKHLLDEPGHQEIISKEVLTTDERR